MSNAKFEESIKSMSDSDLAKQIAKNLGEYRTLLMEPETTMSVPELNKICLMADEMSRRLLSKQ